MRPATRRRWKGRIAAQEQSGLTIQAFADQKGFTAHSFYRARRYFKEEQSKPAFLEVAIKTETSSLRIQFGKRAFVDVDQHTDLDLLRQVIERLC